MRHTICFFNTTKAWGGGEKWHFDLSQYLSEKNYDVIVVCQTDSELHKRLAKTKIKHLALNIHKLSYLNPLKIRGLVKIFKKEKIETIIMNLSSDLKLAAHAAKKAEVKRIIYRRGSAIPLKNSFYNRFIFKNWVDEILVNSKETKRTINKNKATLFPESKIKVIYNGINIDRFNDCLNKKNNEKIILGNIARLEKQKGHKLLIDIANILKEKKLNFELRIVGDGSLFGQLKQQIEKQNLTEYVKLLGYRSDIDNFLKNIDIFLLSSLWEGFGYVLTEAMACYTPVVAFNISSNPEIVEHNKTGYLIPPFELETFANAVFKLASDKNLRTEFGINARRRVENLFDQEKIFKEIEHYLAPRS